MNQQRFCFVLLKLLGCTQVDGGGLASHHLSPGDEVLFMQGVDALHLPQSEAQEVLQRAGRTLELLVAKQDRPNTPVSVPEHILLARQNSPEPEDDQDDQDDDKDKINDDDAAWEQDDEELKRRLVATYHRLRREKAEQRQQRVLRADTWWIQDPDKDPDREDNVRPSSRLAHVGWPLSLGTPLGTPRGTPQGSRRNSIGEAAPCSGRDVDKVHGRRVATTLPRRARSLHSDHRRPRRSPADTPDPTTPRQAPATAPPAVQSVSPFQLQFDEALDIIEQCRAQLEHVRSPSRLSPLSRPPSRGPSRTDGKTPDLIDLNTELDPLHPWRCKQSDPSPRGPSPPPQYDTPGSRLSQDFWREFDERLEQSRAATSGRRDTPPWTVTWERPRSPTPPPVPPPPPPPPQLHSADRTWPSAVRSLVETRAGRPPSSLPASPPAARRPAGDVPRDIIHSYGGGFAAFPTTPDDFLLPSGTTDCIR